MKFNNSSNFFNSKDSDIIKSNKKSDNKNSVKDKSEVNSGRGIFFSKEKILFVFGLVMMVFSSCISVFAASFLYNSNEVSFNNSSSPSISSNNVQGAIDELYSAASDYSALQSRVAALEDRWDISGNQSRLFPTTIELNANGALSGFGGFIDFHYAGSSADFTSRIIENASGKLNLQAPNGVMVNGTDVSTKVNQALTPTRGSGSIKYYCYGSTCMVKLANYNPGSITARTTVATVPAGYRPITEVTGFLGGSSNCGMGVTDAGAVWVEPSCANTGVYLNVTYPKMQ